MGGLDKPSEVCYAECARQRGCLSKLLGVKRERS